MPTKPRVKKNSKNSSLVPVLFTLGVIGWGFFAIDRLTNSGKPPYQQYTTEAHDYVQDSASRSTSWKKSTEEFIKNFTAPSKIDEADPENWKPVTNAPVNEATDEQHSQKSQILTGNYTLYFYQDTNGLLKLSKIQRKLDNEVNLKDIYKEMITGPASITQSRVETKNLIDSFPLKPTVLDAYIENSILILNLDDNFGQGISFETAELQVKQIVKTAAQFKNVHSIQLLINGEKKETIQVDGLTIPALINTQDAVSMTHEQGKNNPD